MIQNYFKILTYSKKKKFYNVDKTHFLLSHCCSIINLTRILLLIDNYEEKKGNIRYIQSQQC